MIDAPAIITVSDLTHRIGLFQLGPVSFTVPEGSITALIGPNGAGKTTLLDLLFGLGWAQHGDIAIAGMQQPRDQVRIKQRVGFVSPDLTYQTGGTVGGAIDFIGGFYPDWNAQECDRLIALFGLGRKDKLAGQSFGTRIKLALIVALARDTDVLLLDEPTTGLDVGSRRHLFAELLAYMEKPGRAVIISSHQLNDLERLADRVAVLNGGQLLALGSTAALVERYQQWDVVLDGSMVPALPGDMRILARDVDRVRVMADLDSPQLAALERLDIAARSPMSLEEVYLGLTGEAA